MPASLPSRGSAPGACRPWRDWCAIPAVLCASFGTVCGQVATGTAGSEPPTPPPVTISHGRATPQRPEAATRTVRHFDFEEMSANPTLLPRFWQRGQAAPVDASGNAHPRPGFPAWNEAELDYAAPASRGQGSVRLPTAGGSTSLLLEPGVIPVLQNADYSITAMVRTDGLRHARARLVARFLDAASKPIAASQAAGELILAEARWKPTAVELVGNFDDAAFIEIELQLLQPDQQGVTTNPHVAPAQDLAGAAWFDDVVVTQLPRIELTTGVPGNVFVRPQAPELRLDVRDLTGEALRAQVTILDATGRVVDRTSRSIGSGRTREPWRPRIDRLGWYRAVLRISNDTALVGQASADFIWIAETPIGAPSPSEPARTADIADRRRFALNVGTLRAPCPDLPEVIRRVASGAVIVPVWGDVPLPGTPAHDGKPSHTIVDDLIDAGLEPTLALDRVPESLATATRSDPEDPWPVLRANAAAADPYVGPLLEKYGQRVRRWMIGRPGDDRAFWRPALGQDMAAISDTLERLVPGPVIGLPWRIDRGLRPEAVAGRARTLVAALVPQDSTADQVTDFGGLWNGAFAPDAAPELMLVMESPPEETYGFAAGLSELTTRTVEFWRAFDTGATGFPGHGPSVALASPWEWSRERRSKLMPRPELAVWSNLVRRLSDRRVAGTFNIAEGVTCYILAPAPGAPAGRTGALVAWNESAPPEAAVLRDYLGKGPVTVVDLFGNSRPAPTEAPDGAPADSDGGTRAVRRTNLAVPIGTEPVFIEGIDPLLARFIGSVHIDPPMLSATSDAHEHALVFENPWQASLDLRSFVVQPGGLDAAGGKDRRWKISPRSGRAIVPPGQQGRIPLSIAFSPAEEAGLKRFVIDLEVTADQAYGLIRVNTELHLGLEGFSVELTRLAGEGRDVVVEAQVTNTSKGPINLELIASAPGFPRSKAPVTALPPGSSVVRRFPYAGALDKLRGKYVTVAASEPESKSRLNRTLKIE